MTLWACAYRTLQTLKAGKPDAVIAPSASIAAADQLPVPAILVTIKAAVQNTAGAPTTIKTVLNSCIYRLLV